MHTDKTAVVTGGGRGIGRAVSFELAEGGASVAVIYSGNQEAAQSVVDEICSGGGRAKAYRCDVRSFEETKEICGRIIKDFDGVDILVNNAGVTRDSLAVTMKEDNFDLVVDTSLKGSFNMIRHLYANFMRRGGRIVNIASVAGISGNAGQANYASAKAGMIGLTKTIAKELASRKVTCNAVAPGFIESDMTAKLSDKARDAAIGAIPLGCAGSARDVAKAVSFLVSDGAAYITGEVLRVDGGMCI